MFNDAPMHEVLELLEYWGDNPPIHVIEAAKAGLGKKKKKGGKPRMVKPRDPTAQELVLEASLPEHIRKIRAEQREERKKRWEEVHG